MHKRVFGFLILVLLLTNTLSVAYITKPTFGEKGIVPPSNVGSSLKPASDEAPKEGAQEGSRGLPNDRIGSPSITGLDRFDNYTYLNGNETRLVVGVDPEKQASVAEFEKVGARYDAKIVNTVSIGRKVSAFVFELSLTSVEGFVEELHAAGLGSYVEPNMKVEAQFVPDDPYWSWQWGPQKIGADWAWNTTVGDHSVLVAVIDTGIYYTHPDLAPNYVPSGWDWVNNDSDPLDDNGHGTHCAGIIAAVLNNSEGIAGLAQVSVMAEKVLDSGGWGYDDWVASGIVHATDCGAKIISMSIGGWGDSELIHEAVKYAYDAGVLVIAAAGNSNSNVKPYPAGYDEVISVAATDEYDNRAWWSNWGDWIELSAPGVDVYSTVPGGYESMSGTSMACPHVAGVAALVWSEYPNRTRDWVRSWLRYTADDLGDPGFDPYYGYGRVNAKNAVQMQPPAHELIASSWSTPLYVEPGAPANVNATVLNFGDTESNVTVELIANDSVVSSYVLDSLSGGTIAKVSLTWNPTVEGEYNLTLYVVPVTGETSLENNALWKYIFVGFPVKAVVLRSAGNVVGDAITSWQTISNEWYLFGDTMVYIDYTTLNKKDITYEDIATTGADVLIISCANDPYAGWQFKDSEIAAITQYVHEGHGLVATSGTFNYAVPNNNKLAPLFGLNSSVMWTATGTDLMHLLNTTHPIFANVPNPLVFPQVTTSLPNDGRWDSDELVNGRYLAIGHYQESAIVEYRGLVYISPYLEVIPPYYQHHLQLLYNAIKWSRYEKPQHALTVSLQTPTHLKPGESALLNATVSNMGLNDEMSVEIRLIINDATVDNETVPLLANGTSYTMQYTWSPSVEGVYNVTAYAPPVLGEDTLSDNVAAATVRVRSITGLVLFDEAHFSAYTVGSNPAEDVTGGYFEFANYLTMYGYTVSTIDPGTTITSSTLASANVLVIVAPQSSYLPSELDTIENWVENGGNLLLISDWTFYGAQARTIAARFGINLQGDGICDSNDNVGYPLGVVYDAGNIIPHRATAGVTRIEMYGGDGIASAPSHEERLIITDTDGTAYWYFSGGSASGVSVASAFEGGRMGCGKLIVVTDSNMWDSAHDTDGDGSINFYDSDNAIFALNCVDWLSFRYQHDLSVRLDAPSFVAPGGSIQLNATVQNLGLSNETNVEVRLLINDSVVNSTTIPELLTAQGYVLSYLWIPTTEGTYNISAYAPPVSGEEYSDNNIVTELVSVRPTKYVLFDQTHSTDYIGSYGTWTTSLTQRGYVVNSLTANPITYGLLEGFDVFVIPQAHMSYSSDELSAIQSFVVSGGGLLVIGDDDPWVYTDLTGFAGITWASGGTSGTTTDITPHAVTAGVTSVDIVSPWAFMNVGGVAQGLVRDLAGNTMLAVSEQPGGKVTGFADEDSLMNSGIGQADNLRLANNMIDWLSVPIPCDHDLSVSLEVPALLQAEVSTLLNATVRNRGLNNETNVELRLFVNGTQAASASIPKLLTGASYTLTYMFGPYPAGTKCNVTAYSPPVNGETTTLNNIMSEIVAVSFYTRTYLQPQWVDGGAPMNWHADDQSWVYTLPFSFPFYGVYYQTIYISSNGLITFNGPDASCGNSMAQLATKLAIAPGWDDWVTYDPYDIYIWQNLTHVGIRWNVRHYGSSTVSNFEAILRRDGVIQLNYAYNDGSISATIGISDGNGEIIAEDATGLNYTNTIVFTPPIPEHELVVALEAPEHLKPGEPTLLNATVMNCGMNNESGVDLQLLVNGLQVDFTTVPELWVGQFCTIGYTWTPQVEGIFNVTAYAPPLVSEELTANNVATKLVNVKEPRGLILWDQTHGTDSITTYSIWTTTLTDRGYIVDTLTNDPITTALLEGYGVFVIPQAHMSYSSDELSAIQSFVVSGGGLLVIGDDDPWVYTDLTGFAGITWASGGTSGTTTDITPHAVTQGVTMVHFDSPMSQLAVSAPAIDLIRDQNAGIMLAVSETGSGRVLGIADEDSINDWWITFFDNLRLAVNMVDWLAGQGVGVPDVAVTDLAVWPSTLYQGWVIHANVTVANFGNVAETFNVSLYYDNNLITTQPVYSLQPNATLSLDFSWTTIFVTPGQNYTMKAAASVVSGEINTGNNVLIDGSVQVRILGDIDGEGTVDILDAILASRTYGSTPSDSQWNMFCDINRDNIIDILDMIMIANNFGRPY